MPLVGDYWTSAAVCRHQPCDPDAFRPVEREPTPYPRPPRELEGTEIGGFQGGAASIYRLGAGKHAWFHFPLITPARLADGRGAYLDRVMLLWEVAGDAALVWATLQHGGKGRRELTERARPYVGRHADDLDDDNTFLLRPRLSVRFGLQLSVMVQAGDAEGQVSFYSVGASFWDEPEA